MAGSLSIFLKICPACAAQVPTGADRCECGHDFELALADSIAPEESSLRDEELYENYLLARSEQAHQAASSARLAAAENPEDASKVSDAELANEVARSIEADLVEQRNKVSALRRLIEVKRPRPARVMPAPAPSVPETVEKQSATESGKANLLIDAVTSSEQAASVEIVAVPMEPAKPESPKKKPVAVSPAASAEKAAQVLDAIKRAKKRENAMRSRKSRSTAQHAAPILPPEPAGQEPVPRKASSIEISATPPDSFRQEQSTRANHVMDSRVQTDGKECPNCTASVPMNTTRCACGFAFVAGGNDLPTLTLCTGDFTALRNSLNLHLRRN